MHIEHKQKVNEHKEKVGKMKFSERLQVQSLKTELKQMVRNMTDSLQGSIQGTPENNGRSPDISQLSPGSEGDSVKRELSCDIHDLYCHGVMMLFDRPEHRERLLYAATADLQQTSSCKSGELDPQRQEQLSKLAQKLARPVMSDAQQALKERAVLTSPIPHPTSPILQEVLSKCLTWGQQQAAGVGSIVLSDQEPAIIVVEENADWAPKQQEERTCWNNSICGRGAPKQQEEKTWCISMV